MYDQRAREILFEAFWKHGHGWKIAANSGIADADFAYAKSKGYMFDNVALSHDQAIAQLIKEREQANLAAISSSFVASLGNRRLDLRSAIGSYAFALNLPDHKIATTPISIVPSGARMCQCCGLYEFDAPRDAKLNVLNFERHKWGGVRHDDPVYAWLDLSLFREEPPLEPDRFDRQLMHRILATARSMPPDATASDLEKALVGMFKSNRAERRIFIEILALCGVLQPRNKTGYFDEFTFARNKEHTGQHLNDWHYPAIWWRGSDGVNEDALAYYFPHL